MSNQPKKSFFDTMLSQIFMIFGMQAYIHEKNFTPNFFQHLLFFQHIASHN